jgi:hypothetical protein
MDLDCDYCGNSLNRSLENVIEGLSEGGDCLLCGGEICERGRRLWIGDCDNCDRPLAHCEDCGKHCEHCEDCGEIERIEIESDRELCGDCDRDLADCLLALDNMSERERAARAARARARI